MNFSELNHNGFKGNVIYSKSYSCWHGKILNVTDLVTYEAQTFDDLKEEFVIAVEDYQETQKANNEK